MRKFYQLTNKSFQDFDVANYKELWDKVQAKGYGAIQMSFVTSFTKAEENENKFHAVLSDAIEDRHGDIVEQNWDLSNFKKNSVLLDSHDYSSIEKIIGKWQNISVKDGRLQGDIEFALENPLGLLAFRLAKGGYLNALSAGFIPLDFGENGEILKSELLEGSMVSVPANARTLIEKTLEKEAGATEKEAATPSPEEKDAKNENGSTEPSDHSPTPPKNDGGVEITENLVAEGVGEGVSEGVAESSAVVTEQTHSLIKELHRELERRNGIMKSVARELEQANPQNLEERKRKIWKELRNAL